MAADYTDLVLVYIRAIAPILLILRVTATPVSSSGDKESDVSINISDINFQPMGKILALTTPVNGVSQDLAEFTRLKLYDFKSAASQCGDI
ncbi:uncharacterized protein ARMOST_22392 [Armillaria ostoyae]|uniref:Uncharacterized protein n=1 Tax=Armillaria ostoyae TaxID=47428 RepID=A0A284SCR1_ARMOS|nr:uncharacterized protein ARMOST_22392 [Armillaria ostoyae]